MQLLRIPEHYKDMTTQATLTGITVLKESKFKARHGGMKIIVQKPREGLILKANDRLEAERLAASKPKRKKPKVLVEDCQVKKVRMPQFRVNKKEVSHRIRNMVNQMKGEKKLFFWTISFPEFTTDDTCYLLFNKWLTRCRRDLNLKSYLWVAERQTGERLTDKTKAATNTIHFHIAIHQRICVQKANRFMRAAIMTCIKNKEINLTHDQAKKYNGVDIAKDRKTKRVVNFALRNKGKSLANYITKYVTKNEGTFKHLAYHCSRDYSNLIIAFRMTEDEWSRVDLSRFIDWGSPLENEWCTFYRWTKGPPDKVRSYLGYVNRIVLNLVNKI
jgi:hypothetical protein